LEEVIKRHPIQEVVKMMLVRALVILTILTTAVAKSCIPAGRRILVEYDALETWKGAKTACEKSVTSSSLEASLVIDDNEKVHNSIPGANCKITKKGVEYKGSIAITISGLTCQRWDSQKPHKHRFGKLAADKNYCRNPSDYPGGPWCYTTNSKKRWEACPVSKCPAAQCKTTKKGVEYGGSIGVTESGLTCQRWDSQTPHKHRFGKLAAEENFCRNPSNHPDGPWCYTTNPNKRWEACPVTICPTAHCRTTEEGAEYKGPIAKTKSGLTCQRWDSQKPHKHRFKELSEEKNFCRNPDDYPEPWCYTTDPKKRFEPCEIPVCPPEQFWIGGTDIGQKGDYIWVNGGKMKGPKDGHWTVGEPKNGYAENCVTINWKQGEWDDQPCDRKHKYICQMKPKADGYSLVGSTFLRYIAVTETWNGANDACKREGATLVKITNDNKDWVAAIGSVLWMGANDQGSEGKWVWPDGSLVNMDHVPNGHWVAGEPNNKGWQNGKRKSENCGATNYQVPGQWNDLDCDHHTNPYICEIVTGCDVSG